MNELDDMSELVKSARNGNFSQEYSNDLISSVLARLWNNCSQNGLSISNNDIFEIQAARSSAGELVDVFFARILETASVRQSNLLKQSNIKYISIGEDCFSRTLLTRWGIKPPAKFSEHSHPFDLAIHPLASIVSLLRSNFENYFNPDFLIFDEKQNICINNKMNIHFNHEKGRDYYENNFKKLQETYKRRIGNFYKDLDFSGETIFVLHVRHPNLETDKYISEIYEEISRLRGDNPWSIRVICTWPNGKKIIECDRELGNIRRIDINYPFDNYVWYNEMHASSRMGFDFEKEIISNLFMN